MIRRSSGVLLHITSLPSGFGIGDLGPGAYRFADFLVDSGQAFWQVLPLNPTNPATGNSPYTSTSSFAGNPLLIDPGWLVEAGWLSEDALTNPPQAAGDRVDYDGVIAYKTPLFEKAFEEFKKARAPHLYTSFCQENADWLEDYATFMAFKEHFGGVVWSDWPAEIRDRQPEAMDNLKAEVQERIQYEKFLQFVFYRQWHALKRYCNDRCVQIIGDIPYYVSYDSADVWTHPEIFKLDEHKKPQCVAGVPPDYFSETGQLWGNPVYDWNRLQASGYAWWVRRMRLCLHHFNMVRIDHFRGFVAYWEVPAGEDTAINGRWVEAPVVDFVNTLLKYFPNLPIIAEDLGLITPDVREVIERFGFPGMRLLLFAFDDTLPRNPYAPHNHVRNCVVYTGTHDNNTVKGWFSTETSDEDRTRLFAYLGREAPYEALHWALIRLAYSSVANLVLIPMQDILGLGGETRMNLPATSDGNWGWRLQAEQITPEVTDRLRQMVHLFGRD